MQLPKQGMLGWAVGGSLDSRVRDEEDSGKNGNLETWKMLPQSQVQDSFRISNSAWNVYGKVSSVGGAISTDAVFPL